MNWYLWENINVWTSLKLFVYYPPPSEWRLTRPFYWIESKLLTLFVASTLVVSIMLKISIIWIEFLKLGGQVPTRPPYGSALARKCGIMACIVSWTWDWIKYTTDLTYGFEIWMQYCRRTPHNREYAIPSPHQSMVAAPRIFVLVFLNILT